jgi:hypothetical protein
MLERNLFGRLSRRARPLSAAPRVCSFNIYPGWVGRSHLGSGAADFGKGWRRGHHVCKYDEAGLLSSHSSCEQHASSHLNIKPAQLCTRRSAPRVNNLFTPSGAETGGGHVHDG